MGGEGMLPLGILLLGIGALAGFIAMRPWPVTPSSKAIKPGAYVVEILQGQPPAASLSAKDSGERDKQINEIENGLTALLLIWAATKVAGAIGSILGVFKL